jgi:phosphatidylserine/phosphatidylglycerophosphate/cardiolipin synthase-like enzyme
MGKANITASFSPLMGEAIEQVVVNALTGAKKVRVLSFLISDPGILNALAAFRDDAKFDIKGVLDPHGMRDVTSRSKQDPELFWFTNDPRFVNAPSHAFNPSREQDFMHNKVLIIDEHLVISGSYNFSENAESNDENLLVIDSPAVATAYTHYFDALFHTYSRASAVSSS